MKSKLFPARIPCYQAVFRKVWILYKFGFVEMCITGYGIMDNSIHSTWKSKEQLSHVLQTELPTIP